MIVRCRRKINAISEFSANSSHFQSKTSIQTICSSICSKTLSSLHGRSQDFFQGGNTFSKFLKMFQKIFKKYAKKFKKNLKKFEKIFKKFSKNFLKKIAKNALF